MKRRLSVLLLASAVLLPAASASPPKADVETQRSGDPMAAMYGNSLMIVIPSVGYQARRFVDPDHTWSETGSEGAAKGTWTIADGDVCFTQTDPAPAPGSRPVCNPATPYKVGDLWTNVDPVSGNTVLVTIAAGRT